MLDIYSSGLTLLAVGLRVPRWAAAAIDGVLMVVGTIVIVWFAADFFGPFQGFLITLGVPIAAWAGIFIGDLVLRRRDYDTFSLFDARGVYGSVNWLNVVGMLVAHRHRLGAGDQRVQGLTWQGYLFGPLGLDIDTWGFSGVGVAVALFGGLVVGLANAGRIRRQEAAPDGGAASRRPWRASERQHRPRTAPAAPCGGWPSATRSACPPRGCPRARWSQRYGLDRPVPPRARRGQRDRR